MKVKKSLLQIHKMIILFPGELCEFAHRETIKEEESSVGQTAQKTQQKVGSASNLGLQHKFQMRRNIIFKSPHK